MQSPRTSEEQRACMAKGMCRRCGRKPIAARSRSRCDSCLAYGKLYQAGGVLHTAAKRERDKIVAWLREPMRVHIIPDAGYLADRIERGEHNGASK